MAVIEKTGKQTVRDIEQDEVEAVIVDINDTSIADGEQQEIDAKEDWQAQAAPPPGDGARYRVKIFSGNKQENHEYEQGTKTGYAENDPKGKYYTKQLSCKIQDEGGAWHNYPVDYKVSTGVPRGKKMSTMAGLMTMAGAKLPERMTDKQVAQTFTKFLAKEPVLTMAGDWSAWDTSAKTKQTPFGVLLLAGMKKFPLKADGKTRNHIVGNKAGQQFVAKLKIIKWVGKVAAGAPTAPAATGNVVAPKVVQQTPIKAPTPPVEEVVAIEETAEFSFDGDGEVVFEG